MFNIRLRDARVARGLTQEELGAEVGVSGQQIYRYEKDDGEHYPDGLVLRKMSKVLGKSVDFLLGLVDDPEGHVSEVDLPQDEREALLAYRDYKNGNSRHIMGVLAKNAPEAS